MNRQAIALVVLVVSLGAGPDLPADVDEEMAQRIARQLESDGRDLYDEVKDDGRKPVETAHFLGVKAGMTVLDVIAGSGYNSEILSAAVGPDGTVYAQNAHFVLRLLEGARHESMLARLANDRLPNVRYMVVNIDDMPFDNDIDIAFWGLNMHDIYNSDGEAETLRYLHSIMRALKPGGVLGVTDHVGIAGQDNAELHRLEPEIVKAMLEKAGFVVEATSDLLGNPDDDHTRTVYADGLRYYTDRILVRARKPD